MFPVGNNYHDMNISGRALKLRRNVIVEGLDRLMESRSSCIEVFWRELLAADHKESRSQFLEYYHSINPSNPRLEFRVSWMHSRWKDYEFDVYSMNLPRKIIKLNQWDFTISGEINNRDKNVEPRGIFLKNTHKFTPTIRANYSKRNTMIYDSFLFFERWKVLNCSGVLWFKNLIRKKINSKTHLDL